MDLLFTRSGYSYTGSSNIHTQWLFLHWIHCYSDTILFKRAREARRRKNPVLFARSCYSDTESIAILTQYYSNGRAKRAIENFRDYSYIFYETIVL